MSKLNISKSSIFFLVWQENETFSSSYEGAFRPKRAAFLLVGNTSSLRSSELQVHIVLSSLVTMFASEKVYHYNIDVKFPNTFASSCKVRIEAYIKFLSL